MKLFTKKYAFLSLLVILIISLGFYRDFIFKSINALLKAKDFEVDYTMPSSLSFMQNWDYDKLITGKWILTIAFTFLFLMISIVAINILFKNKKYISYTFWAYVAITGIALFIIALGYLFKKNNADFYSVSRYLMGMVQSPILLMILIPAFKISELQKKEIPKTDSN